MKYHSLASILLISGLTCIPVNAQTSSEASSKSTPTIAQHGGGDPEDNSPEELLQRGLYFSDLYNWFAARPYLIKAKQLFEEKGDTRNTLYADLAAIRAGADPDSLPELSYRVTTELSTNPIFRTDRQLRMFCLVVKGELDGELDSAAMRRDWTEVGTLAQ